MRYIDALQYLGLDLSSVTLEDIRKAYSTLEKKYNQQYYHDPKGKDVILKQLQKAYVAAWDGYLHNYNPAVQKDNGIIIYNWRYHLLVALIFLAGIIAWAWTYESAFYNPIGIAGAVLVVLVSIWGLSFIAMPALIFFPELLYREPNTPILLIKKDIIFVEFIFLIMGLGCVLFILVYAGILKV